MVPAPLGAPPDAEGGDPVVLVVLPVGAVVPVAAAGALPGADGLGGPLVAAPDSTLADGTAETVSAAGVGRPGEHAASATARLIAATDRTADPAPPDLAGPHVC